MLVRGALCCVSSLLFRLWHLNNFLSQLTFAGAMAGRTTVATTIQRPGRRASL